MQYHSTATISSMDNSHYHFSVAGHAEQHWAYTDLPNDSFVRPSSAKDQMLYGVGGSLHVNPLDITSPFLTPFEFETTHYPAEVFTSERKIQDMTVPPLMPSVSDLSQYGSPKSEGSSQGCDTFSACYSDDVHMNHHHSTGSPVQIHNQPYYSSPCNVGTADFEYAEFNLFPTAHSPVMPPGAGGGISLSVVQPIPDQPYETPELLEAQCSDEEDGEGESDHEYLPPAIPCKVFEAPHPAPLPDRYDEDSFAGSTQDSMSVAYEDLSEEEDGDYNPRSGSKGTARTRRVSGSRRASHGRRHSSGTNGGRITKPKAKKANNASTVKFFPCPLTKYGCKSTFTSKNEWKRHVSTQHIKQGFWRCDMCHPTDPNNPSYNDFNRKDLFIQHLRRMHRSHPLTLEIPSSGEVKRDEKGEPEISDEAVTKHQARCYVVLRTNPTRSECLFCAKHFEGQNSWDERMEHVGSHMERERKANNTVPPCSEWRDDQELEDYLLQEGLIEFESGKWNIGDGIPRRIAEDEAVDDY